MSGSGSGSGPFGVRDDAPRPPGEPAHRPAPPVPPPPAEPAGRSTVTWIVGIAVVLALVYITLNTLRTEAPGSRGLEAGTALPPFAAPLALSDLEGDANVATEAGSGDLGARPACEVRGPDILNSCQLAARGPVVLAFLAARSEICDRQVDVLDRVRGDYPDVSFAAVAIRGDRDELRDVVRRRGWGLPVAHDADGAVANAYAVAICPTITFAYRGGRVEGTSLTLLEGAELRRRIERLEAGP